MCDSTVSEASAITSELEELRQRIGRDKQRPEQAQLHFRQVAEGLLRLVPALETYTPVVVLRGGTPLWHALHEVGPGRECGLVAPHRHGEGQRRTIRIAYGSLPAAKERGYLLLDMISATADTLVAVGTTLRSRRSVPAQQIGAAVPFMSAQARGRYHDAFPGGPLYFLWGDEVLSSTGRLAFPGYDVGDLAMGSTTAQDKWCSEP